MLCFSFFLSDKAIKNIPMTVTKKQKQQTTTTFTRVNQSFFIDWFRAIDNISILLYSLRPVIIINMNIRSIYAIPSESFIDLGIANILLPNFHWGQFNLHCTRGSLMLTSRANFFFRSKVSRIKMKDMKKKKIENHIN